MHTKTNRENTTMIHVKEIKQNKVKHSGKKLMYVQFKNPWTKRQVYHGPLVVESIPAIWK